MPLWYNNCVNVPLFKQKRKTCGPTALRMVLAHHGHDIPSDDILLSIGGLKTHGVNTIDLAEFARAKGFKVECLSYNKKLAQGKAEIRMPSKTDILRHLGRNNPVILAVHSPILYGGKIWPQGHFIVLTGYKDGIFTYNDPSDGEIHEIDEEHLMFAWHNNVLDSSAYFLAVWPKEETKGVSV
jgi:ABC-type bacteriocin/lantibiotic exporter with double-glycine peptidase domain